jgi:predicted ABC-type transport system involved in lysophospholipase L1 biosynthesis ATPase subunit
MELFDRLVAAGQTMILVTHNPAYKDRVQRVLRMHDGRVEGDRAVIS